MTDTNKPSYSAYCFYPEFDSPMMALFEEAISKFVEIEMPYTKDMPNIALENCSKLIQIEISQNIAFYDILNTNTDAWAFSAYSIALQLAKGKQAILINELDNITKKTGNIISAQGPMSHDILLDTLESMDFEVDENGEPQGLSMIVHPIVAEQIVSLPPRSSEQEKRYNSLILRQREKNNASKRTRTLD